MEPSATHPLADRYRAPGGAWDVPPLDVLLSSATAREAAVVDSGRRRTTAALDDDIDRLAGGLRNRGVGRGDSVAFQSPNSLETLTLARACWRIGAVAAILHHQSGPAQLDASLGQLDPALLVAADGFALAERSGVVTMGGAEWAELMSADPVADRVAEPADVATVSFTSGSSGVPKGVVHTHRGWAYKAGESRAIHALTPDDTVLMPSPMAHVAGLMHGIVTPGAIGMKVVLMARWNPDDALDLVEREQVTFMLGPPTFFVAMMGAPTFSPERVASLRLLSCGGAGVTAEFCRRAMAEMGCVVKRTFGCTEVPSVTTSGNDDPVEQAITHDGRSVGAAELRAVDPDTGIDRPPGEPGELWIRGPEVCEGYLDPARTADAWVDGWFRTGDLVTLDAEGWLTVVGRIKDIIIRGGENIPAATVEAALEAHPGVEAAVAVGMPDEAMGERVLAFVVAPDGFDLETCRSWFAERGETRFMTPERIEVVEALPMLASGKADREELRRRAGSLSPRPASG